jgi:hypothetical protein
MKTYTFGKDWPVRLNERQDTTYLAGVSYPLDDDMAARARAAGVLDEPSVPSSEQPKAKAKRVP